MPELDLAELVYSLHAEHAETAELAKLKNCGVIPLLKPIADGVRARNNARYAGPERRLSIKLYSPNFL